MSEIHGMIIGSLVAGERRGIEDLTYTSGHMPIHEDVLDVCVPVAERSHQACPVGLGQTLVKLLDALHGEGHYLGTGPAPTGIEDPEQHVVLEVIECPGIVLIPRLDEPS